VELHQLEYFVAVADEGGFTAGARRAGVVQSATSAAVRRLEEEFGVDLFVRSGRRVTLTDPGRLLLDHAREVLAAARVAREVLEARRQGLTGTVVVGTLLSTGSLDLAAALRTFHERHPGVLVRLRHSPGHSEEHLATVRAGATDLAVVLVPDRPLEGVRIEPVASINQVLVAPAGHPLARRIAVSLADLSDETFVDFPVGWGNREGTDAVFRAAGVSRTVSIEATDVASTLELVAGGLGLAFVPAREVIRGHDVVPVPLDVPLPSARLGIASTSRRRLSPATDALRRALLGTG
jgi:DNA-binding transcriptional LysR family regulator